MQSSVLGSADDHVQREASGPSVSWAKPGCCWEWALHAPLKCGNVRHTGHSEDLRSCLCSFSTTLESGAMHVSGKMTQLFLMGKVL